MDYADDIWSLGSRDTPIVRVWLLIETGDTEAIDVFLTPEDAERERAQCVRDEPKGETCCACRGDGYPHLRRADRALLL